MTPEFEFPKQPEVGHHYLINQSSWKCVDFASETMFIQDDFDIPDNLVTEQFRFVVLEPSLIEIDYEAVMSSKQRLKHVFAEHDDWPADDMTVDFNRSDLIQHEKEFIAREAFAYAVLSPTEDRYIGCVYLNPTTVDDYDCEVYLWVADDELHLDRELFESTDKWLKTEWPFTQPAYPGRTISWTDWNPDYPPEPRRKAR